MRLKDVLALPKDVNSLPLLKSYLNQSLDYHDHMAAFLHYIDILYYVKSYEILIQESEGKLTIFNSIFGDISSKYFLFMLSPIIKISISPLSIPLA